ncbi:MAG: cation:proton antiporter [Methanomicrobiales archaeon]|nr:cation:proton antiporter [Methanomicrobiales archaeon]MDI6875160.1 cation:proton antiporter [Methanomicrobiales archaeon]
MDAILQIIVILVVAKLFGELVERGGYPSLVGEIAAGIILGPSLLNLVAFDTTIELFSDIGVIVLLFISGAELNLRSFVAAEVPSLSTALGGVLVPVLMGFLFGSLAGYTLYEVLFLGIALSITSIGISVRTLIDLRRLDTALGTTIVGAAVFDDVFGILMLTLLTAVTSGQEFSLVGFAETILATIIFLALVLTGGRRGIRWIFARTRGSRLQEMSFSAALIIALLVAFLSNAVGLHYAIGAFLAGLILGDQVRNDRILFDSLVDLGFGFFVTIFFASIGLLFAFSLDALLSPLVLLLIAVSLLSKVLGGYLGSILFCRDPLKALIVGLGLYPRGEITLVVAKIALLSGFISVSLYASVTLVIIVSIILTPFLLKRTFQHLSSRKTTGGRPAAGGR